MCRIVGAWKALGGYMCRILRVWKLKTLINSLHLRDLEAPGGPASNHAKGPGGSA